MEFYVFCCAKVCVGKRQEPFVSKLEMFLKETGPMSLREKQLSDLLGPMFRVSWLQETESTNTDVKRELLAGEQAGILVCLADRQTKGKGTRGRVWESEQKALLVSIGLTLTEPIPSLMPVLGWDVMQCCRQVDSRVRVKWPNDLWIEGKKLGGILCEVVHLKSGQTGLVIGIGINLKGTNKERAYLSLRSDGYVDFFADVIRTAARCVKTFTPEKIKQIGSQWSRFDALYGTKVFAQMPNGRIISGTEQGINEKGELILSCGTKRLAFSDITLQLHTRDGKSSDGFIG